MKVDQYINKAKSVIEQFAVDFGWTGFHRIRIKKRQHVVLLVCLTIERTNRSDQIHIKGQLSKALSKANVPADVYWSEGFGNTTLTVVIRHHRIKKFEGKQWEEEFGRLEKKFAKW